MYNTLLNITLRTLRIIQKSDKDNSIVLADRDKYIKKMENFLSDQTKFQKTPGKDVKFLNFLNSQEKRIDKIYKKLIDFNSMFEEIRRHLKTVETRSVIIYPSCKVHENVLVAVRVSVQFYLL